MKRIHDSLDTVLLRHRVVFWYDGENEWTKAFNSYESGDVKKLTVEGNEFGTKVSIHRSPKDRFLVYFPSTRPADAENWLLDVLLQGHEYKADRASLALQELGLPFELRPVVDAHSKFFDDSKRVLALRRMLEDDESVITLRRKLMAVAAGADRTDVDALLLSFLGRFEEFADDQLVDLVQAKLSHFALVEPFWKEVSVTFGYVSETPSLHDFVRTLFRHANPLDQASSLNSHAQVFLEQWKDSQGMGPLYRRWAEWMQKELNLDHQINASGDLRSLIAWDTFPKFEHFVLNQLFLGYEDRSIPSNELRELVNQRRSSFWFREYVHAYEALGQAITLRDLLDTVELQWDSVESGVSHYVNSWHRIDRAYRKYHFHARSCGIVSLLERISKYLDKVYVANFLVPLTDRWGDQITSVESWPPDVRVTHQVNFFSTFVAPFVQKQQKVCVVVSDALRYEIGVELKERLLAENRWKAEIEPMLAALPSYTQLGMAALLPGKSRIINPEKKTVSIDGLETAGTDARKEILQTKLGKRTTALGATAFMEMNSTTEARELIRDHDVIYLYHNIIDDTGDKLASEAQTTEAVEAALLDLVKVLKKLANANGGQILLTADHGFLFQQTPVAETDDFKLPPAEKWLFQQRRFALGQNITASAGIKTFSASQLGMAGDWDAAFPPTLGRFPLSGSGKRFVHGGFSLQETLVPVLRIHKTRSNDTEKVEVDLLRAPSKITTGRVSLTFYQEQPIATKRLPRALRIGVFSKDDVAISDHKTLTFDSESPEARQREVTLELVLSHLADSHNGKEVEVRLEEVMPNDAKPVPYKTHPVKLQKPFATDFDEF